MVPTQASSAANALQQANGLLGTFHDGTTHTAAGVPARPSTAYPIPGKLARSAEAAPPQPGPSTLRPPARQRRKTEKAREMDGIYETDMVLAPSARRPAAAINPHGVEEDGSSEEPGSSAKRHRIEEYSPGDGEGQDIEAGMELQDGMFIMLQECDLSTGKEKPDRAPLPCYFSQTATDRLHGELADFFAGTQHEAYRQRAEQGTLYQSSFFGGKIGRFRKDGSLDVVYFAPCPHPGFFEQDMWVMFTTPATARAYCEDWEPEKPRPYYVMKRVSPWRQPRTHKRQKTPDATGGAPEAGPSAVALDMPEQPPPSLPPASDTLQAWVAAAVEGGQPEAAAAVQTEAGAAQGDVTAPMGGRHATDPPGEARATGGHIAHASGSSTGPTTTARSPNGNKARAPTAARAAAVGVGGAGSGHGEENNIPINAQAVIAALIRSQIQINSLTATATTQAAAATTAQAQPVQAGVANTGPAAAPVAVTRRPSAGSGASAGPAPPAVITLIPGQAAKAARPRQASQPGMVPGPSGATHRPTATDGPASNALAACAGTVEAVGPSGLRAAVLEGLKKAGALDQRCRAARANVATKEAELAAARQESAARDQQLGLHLITVKQMAARLDPPQSTPMLAGSETPSFSAALSSLETAEALCTALEAELKQHGQAVRMTDGSKVAAKAACMRAQQELFEADSSPATFGRAQQKVGEANAVYSDAVALWTAATEALNACQEQHAAAQAARDTALAPVLAFLRQLPTTL